MPERWTARVVRRLLAVEPSVAVFTAGLALAMYLQGAYYGWAQLVVASILFSGVLLLPRLPVFGREDVPVGLAAAGLAGWTVIDGVLKHEAGAGARGALLIAGVVLFAACCREIRGNARADLVHGMIMVCCLVAALGWTGVVVHHRTWGFEGPGMWRASSTLTYPNATAALLAVAALVCLAVRTRNPGSRRLGIAATVLLTGLAATLSRAGLLGFAVGAAVLVVGFGWRPVIRSALAPLLGAAVATAGLLPSITTDAPTAITIATAVAGALAGLAVGSRTAASRLLVLVPVVAVAVAVFAPRFSALGARFTLDSPDRWDAVHAAWRLFTENPLTGAGPGLVRLTLERPRGGLGFYSYAHNEYVQVLAELGAVGGVLLLALLLTLGLRLRRPQPAARALGVGVLAGTAALVVHAGFDFVWHVPAILLFTAALIGLAVPQPQAGRDPAAQSPHKEHKEIEGSNT